jgi:hypothetical protein
METPEKIYLQWPDQEPPEGSSEIDPAYITWCQDRIEDHDVKYVRSDLIESALAENKRLRDALLRQIEHDKYVSYERCPDCDYPTKCSRTTGCLEIKSHSPIAEEALK